MATQGSLEHALARRKPVANSILNATEKYDWSTDGHTFCITGVEFEDDRFGPRWLYTVDDGTDLPRRIALGANPGRDADATAMQEEINESGAVGPVVLTAKPLSGGKSVWTFQDAPDAAFDPNAEIPF